jgi:hypothetical protein
VRDVGRVSCGRSVELLRAAVKKKKKCGDMVMKGGGGEGSERVGRWCSAKVAATRRWLGVCGRWLFRCWKFVDEMLGGYTRIM